MGRMLDSLYAVGVTELFLELAKEAHQAFAFPVRALHVEAGGVHVHGKGDGPGVQGHGRHPPALPP